MGTVVTFYSYKGGVGRTMALANIAALLAMWGRKVLVVDWDLEAPGVEHFLAEEGSAVEQVQEKRGLIDLLTQLSETPSAIVPETAWKSLLVEAPIPRATAKISLLTAGARTQGYFKNVRKLDVKSFYEDKNGGHIIEALRRSWKSNFDFVLVDSRTGITDIGGICTIQLPDILAIVFTATAQSLNGAVDVARKAAVERQKLPFDRSLVPTVPIPSRFDTQTEHEIAKAWLGRFEKALSPLFDQWLPSNVRRREFLELTKIPYTPFFSFGESLPVIEQGTTDPAGLGYAYETVAALVGNNLEHADLLLSNRDEFVRLARSPDHLPRTPLRDLPLPCVLLIDLVGSSALRSAFAREETPQHLQQKTYAAFHATMRSSARDAGGELAMSDGESFLFAFPDVPRAIKCAVSVEESLAIKRPINSPAGALRVRMGLHAAKDSSTSSMQLLLQTATKIASKAREGEIVASGTAAEQVTEPMKGVKIERKGEQMELTSAKGKPPVLEDLVEIIPVTPVVFQPAELDFLFKQNPESKGGGGFQAFLVGLQERVKMPEGYIELTIKDRERIARYAHDYRGGGWQGRLRKLFGRTLGSNLGREKP